MKRRQVFKAAGVVGAAGLLGSIPQQAKAVVDGAQVTSQSSSDGGSGQEDAVEVTVVQRRGKETHWVSPGKRPLSRQVFGTPGHSVRGTHLHEHQLRMVAESDLPEVKKKRLLDFLTKGGMPPMACTCPETKSSFNYNGTTYKIPDIRETHNGSRDAAEQTRMKTPFGDPAVGSQDNSNLSGHLDITYKNRQHRDEGGMLATDDEVDVDCEFTDPGGNDYRVNARQVFQPPIPVWETGGGVLTFTYHHGQSGTGPALVPQVFTYGAVWSVGDIFVNGENETEAAREALQKKARNDGRIADDIKMKGRVIHVMTTDTIRNSNYDMALDEQLPLSEEEAYNGEKSHTHVMVPPIAVTNHGPVKLPLQRGFDLKDGGETVIQPFIHFMFDEDTVREIKLIGQGYDGSYN